MRKAPFTPNEILCVFGNSATILLNDGHTACLDVADLPLIAGYRWYLGHGTRGIYIYAHVPGSGRGGRRVTMHRLIKGVTDPKVLVDHEDGDGTNNRRRNLRLANHSQNAVNSGKFSTKKSSDFKGVTRKGDRFAAYVTFQRKNIYAGTFATQEQAAMARDAKATELHGEFARLNFPVVQAAGLEPAITSFGGWCLIHLDDAWTDSQPTATSAATQKQEGV